MLHRASKFLDEPFGSIESNRELLQSAAGQKKSQKPSKGPKYRWGFRKYLNPRTNPTLWGWELVGRAANASIECVMVFSNVPSKISSIRDDPDFKPRDFPPKVDVCKFKKIPWPIRAESRDVCNQSIQIKSKWEFWRKIYNPSNFFFANTTTVSAVLNSNPKMCQS